MSDQIPEAARLAVKQRERFLCLRCSGHGAHWHHRRKRSIKDDHRHCTCNGVWLCSKCHTWAHGNPSAAKDLGLILSSWTEFPGEKPVTNSFGQQVLLTCDGRYGGQA